MRYLSAFVLAACLAACGGSASAPHDQSGGIRFISGNGAADTASAFLTAPLIVEVRTPNGDIVAPTTIVRFDAVRAPNNGAYETSVESLTGTGYTTSTTGTTDQTGRTGVLVRLGIKSGTARIVVSVPTLSLVDTAAFTVNPGMPTHVAISPADTAITIGATLALAGGLADQYGNVVTGTAAWTASNATVSVTSSGVVSGVAIGRDTIKVTAGGLTATAAVSVVPDIRVVGWRGSAPNVVLVNLDGTHLVALASAANGGIGLRPRWMPDGKSVVYTAAINEVQVLQRVDTLGAVTPFFATTPPFVTHQADPAPTADGNWLYFSAYDSRCSSSAYCLYRSKIDGTAAELLGSSSTSNSELRPSPSPDGSMVAFVRAGHIKIYNVGNAQLTAVDVIGGAPTWSPDGSLIAYIPGSGNGPITTMKPDGTGAHAVTAANHVYFPSMMSWSADGKYIIGFASATRWELVVVQTGATVPLPFLSTYGSLAFR